MFTLFTSAQFGRGLVNSTARQSELATYLAAYRRNRAKIRSQAPLAIAA
jgi:hypothetical protein